MLFWVNLARKDKHLEPSAQVVQPEQIPVRQEGEAIVRVLVGEGSPVHLGTPALILDIELPKGGQITTPVPPGFQGFAYVLEGEGAFGANLRPARPPQLVLLGPGEGFTVTDAAPGTRYLLMAGQPYGEVPVFERAVRGLDRVAAGTRGTTTPGDDQEPCDLAVRLRSAPNSVGFPPSWGLSTPPDPSSEQLANRLPGPGAEARFGRIVEERVRRGR